MSHKTYFTPGPSQLYFTVPDHLRTAIKQGIGSISHRSSAFKQLYKETTENIKILFQLPDDYHVVFTASATEVWERILQNLVESSSLHLVNGSFSAKFYEFAQLLGKNAQKLEAPWGTCSTPNNLSSTQVELLAITHNETSTGATQTQEDLRTFRKNYPGALISLDVVSSAPIYPLDYSIVDTFYFSVQKAFGLPAGLGVWVYNSKCLEIHNRLKDKQITGTYHRLSELHQMGEKYQTPETPNVLYIYLLNEVVKDFLRKGQESIWREAQYKSTLLYSTLENTGLFKPFVKEKSNRSITTLVFENLKNIDVITKLSHEGMVIGKGYGKFADDHIRIANFPTHSKEQVEKLCDIIEKL